MEPLKALRSIGYYTTAVAMTGAMGTLAGAAALAGDRSGKVWWPATRMWARGLLQSAGVSDLIVKGVEHIYDGRPYVLMANHQSHLDPPALIRSSERPIGFLAKKELEKIPLFGWAMRRTGHVFVDRADKAESHRSIDHAAGQVAEGRCVLVFPEGTRSTTGDLQPFKKGGFVLAIKAQVAIVPVGVFGTREVLPSNSSTVAGRSPVAVVYGEPIPTAGLELEHKDAVMAAVHDAIVALRAEARALVDARLDRALAETR